ncbi:MAG TPA: exosortase/archaeosortase family protein [Terriglobales bacterium]|nr:exosortase/archaeosortase family protein [Terriglobales bacterium]
MDLFWRRLLWMMDLWWSDGLYSLSALVPLVSLAILYGKRNKLRALPVHPSAAGIPLVIVAVTITLAADELNILRSFTPLLIVLMLGGIIVALWGTAILKELLFPLTFLLMLLPIPPSVLQRIDLPLQILCARAVESLAHAAGFAMQRAGCMLLFPGSQTVEVAPACNGVRSSLTLLMLSMIYVYLSRARWQSKLAVLAAALPLAYLANLVRLFGIVSGVHFLGDRFMDYEQVFDHLFGLLVFSGCVSMLLLWAQRVKCKTSVAIS